MLACDTGGTFTDLALASNGVWPPAQHVRSKARHLNEISPVGQITVKTQQSIFSRIAAGGGYGDPLERDWDQVARDLSSGLLTLKRAEAIHGVVERDSVLDTLATARQRATVGSHEEARRGESTPVGMTGPMEPADGTL